MKLHLHTFELPLRHVFTISRESLRVQKTLIVELEEDGSCGFGEATTNAYYGFTIETMSQALEEIRPLLQRQTLIDPVGLWEQMHPRLEENPFAGGRKSLRIFLERAGRSMLIEYRQLPRSRKGQGSSSFF